MKTRTATIALIAGCLLMSGCPIKAPSGTFSRSGDGEVNLYLQPAPREFHRIRFVLQAIAAVREDGQEIPFSINMSGIVCKDLIGSQKLIGSCIVPPAKYTGLSITFGDAYIGSEEGEHALLVKEKALFVSHPFVITRDQSLSLFLKLSPSDILEGGVVFTPTFSLASASPELVNLIGYVANTDVDSITVFNKQSMRVTGSISTGRGPTGVVFDPLRRRAYVVLSGEDAVQVIDIFEGTVEARIPLFSGDDPRDLAITPDGRTLVVADHGSNMVSIVDAMSMFETRRVRVGQAPVSVVLNRDASKAYVMNSRSNTISVVDLTQPVPAVSLSMEGSPVRAALNRRGDRLYVISPDSPYLVVIDTLRWAVTEKLHVGIGASFIIRNPMSDLFLVSLATSQEIAIVDPLCSLPIDYIPVGGRPAYMAFDTQENSIFVVLPQAGTLQKVNFISKRVSGEIDATRGAYAVAVMGEKR